MKTGKTWAIVVNGETAQFFDYVGLKSGLTSLPDETMHAEQREFAREQGMTNNRMGSSMHRMASHTGPDPVHLEFAQDIWERLQHAHQDGRFENLILCASPEMLGLLRKKMPAQMQNSIEAELNKDLTHMTELELADYLAERLA